MIIVTFSGNAPEPFAHCIIFATLCTPFVDIYRNKIALSIKNLSLSILKSNNLVKSHNNCYFLQATRLQFRPSMHDFCYILLVKILHRGIRPIFTTLIGRGSLPFLNNFVGIDQSRSALSDKKATCYQINDGLFGIVSQEVSLFQGNAAELIHDYRPLCMTFATFFYNYWSDSDSMTRMPHLWISYDRSRTLHRCRTWFSSDHKADIYTESKRSTSRLPDATGTYFLTKKCCS